MTIPDSLDFQIVHSTAEIDAESWDALSAGRAFTSHQWYRYGEAVLADCEPTYLIVNQHGRPIGRATFWRTADEPSPIRSTLLRFFVQAALRRWPLMICRSPLSSLSGLILPEPPLCKTVQQVIGSKARELASEAGCSYLIFDYLSKQGSQNWPETFSTMTISDPGTVMRIDWPSFEAYLEAGNKKDRQHYKKTVREAEKLGIQVSRHSKVDDIEEALALVRGVERRHGSAENPWARAMLERIEMIDGIFLTARIGTRLVACGLVLQDNGTQINATLGLVAEVPYVYFMLVYESMKIAFEHKARFIRLGSGTYDVKQQLGFSQEDNNTLSYCASNRALQVTSRWLEKLA